MSRATEINMPLFQNNKERFQGLRHFKVEKLVVLE
jgi:hypothetical protein